MDWPQVFPCSIVPFAFGLYEVTAWCGSLPMMIPGMYSLSPGDLKSPSWPGLTSGRVQTPWALLNYALCDCMWEWR